MRHKSLPLSFLLTLLLTLSAFAQQDVITTKIGGGPSDMPALDADLNDPAAIAFDGSGNYYLANYNTNQIYKISSTGLLTLFAGNGLAGYSGDGVVGGATSAMLNGPNAIATDSAGNVYIADYNNFVIREVNASTNTITTVAGTQGPSAAAQPACLCYPAGLTVDASGNLFIADTSDCQIKKFVPSTSTMTLVAGTGTCGYTGNGASAVNAELNQPLAVAVDSSDNVFIADTYNYVVREVHRLHRHHQSRCRRQCLWFQRRQRLGGQGRKSAMSSL